MSKQVKRFNLSFKFQLYYHTVTVVWISVLKRRFSRHFWLRFNIQQDTNKKGQKFVWVLS